MTEQELWQSRLRQAQKECRKHAQRLRYIQEKAQPLFPLDTDRYENLDDDGVGLIDQLLFRFGKLQDTVGQRIFPALLHVLLEWQENQSFLDRLLLLEKLEVIDSAQDWTNLRELRNTLTHEYPDSPEHNTQSLNLLWQKLSVLLEIWEQIASRIDEC